jgi:hypothetical protein
VKPRPTGSGQQRARAGIQRSGDQALIGVESTREDCDDPRQDELPVTADRPPDPGVRHATSPKLSSGKQAELSIGQSLQGSGQSGHRRIVTPQ